MEVMTEDNIEHNHNEEQIENGEEVSNEGQMILLQNQWSTVNAEVGNDLIHISDMPAFSGS